MNKNIYHKTLSSGTQVIMEKIPYVKSTAIGVWVKAGAVNETAQNHGISHYIEHMLFKGTPKRSAREIAQDIDRIGGQINAFTGKESTCYYVKVPDSNVKKASEVLFDLFLNSEFDGEEMEKEKNVVYEEINMHEDSPEDDLHDIFCSTVFKDSPLGYDILGSKKTLGVITKDTILKYMDQNYTAQNIVIAVSGNFHEDEIIDIFEEYFQKVSMKKQEEVVFPLEYKPSYVFKKKDIEQAHLSIGLKGIAIDDDMHYAFHIVNNVMGGSMSSRLFQSIREEKGMAYSVYSYMSSYAKDGMFGVYAGVGQDQAAQTISLIIEELDKLKKGGIAKDEFETAKEQLKGTYTFSLESVSGRMVAIGKSQLLLGKIYEPEEVLSSIDRVSMEDLQEVIEMITDISSYSGAAIGRKKVDLKGLLA